jgi:hypothetical protein
MYGYAVLELAGNRDNFNVGSKRNLSQRLVMAGEAWPVF